MPNHSLSFIFAATFAFAVIHMGSAAAQGVQHFAALNGGNEVSAAGAAAAGDADGSGAASITVSGTRVCFSILVENIGAPNAAHIHEAEAGANGPIVVTLLPPANGNPGARAGCVTGLGAGLITRLRNTPNQFYVNVHNGAFPAGAVRGQLF
jgi:hypothetical protein